MLWLVILCVLAFAAQAAAFWYYASKGYEAFVNAVNTFFAPPGCR